MPTTFYAYAPTSGQVLLNAPPYTDGWAEMAAAGEVTADCSLFSLEVETLGSLSLPYGGSTVVVRTLAIGPGGRGRLRYIIPHRAIQAIHLETIYGPGIDAEELRGRGLGNPHESYEVYSGRVWVRAGNPSQLSLDLAALA